MHLWPKVIIHYILPPDINESARLAAKGNSATPQHPLGVSNALEGSALQPSIIRPLPMDEFACVHHLHIRVWLDRMRPYVRVERSPGHETLCVNVEPYNASLHLHFSRSILQVWRNFA